MTEQVRDATQMTTGRRGLLKRGLAAGAAAVAAGAAGALVRGGDVAHAADGATVTVGTKVQSSNPSSNPTWIEGKVNGNPTFRATNGSIPFSGGLHPFADGVQGHAQGANNAGLMGGNESNGGKGVFGYCEGSLGTGVEGSAGGDNSVAVRAFAPGQNSFGVEATGRAAGVRGHGYQGVGIGVHGSSTDNYGVYGGSAKSLGVFGYSDNATGVYGSSPSGFGVYGNATKAAGVFGNSPIIGVHGQTTVGHGVRGVASGAGVGVFGQAGPGGLAAYFDGPIFVNGAFTVLPGAPKSVAVDHPDGSMRRMYCQESPEPWFEDFGEGKLAGGRADVKLDPDFAAVVKSDKYLVFVTEVGDAGGLYVTGQTATSFEVKARSATASGAFFYRVVARRKDVAGPRLEKIDKEKVTRVKQDGARQLAVPTEPKLPTLPDVAAPTRGTRPTGR